MRYFSFIALLAMIMLGGNLPTAYADSSEKVINFLQEKGVITQEDAESFNKDGKPILSLRGGKVRFGGELELEFVDSEGNLDPNNNPNSRMRIDKFVFSTQVQLSNNLTFRSDIQASGAGKIKVDEAWIKYKGLPFNSWITIGLDDIFIKPHRKTEAYPILGYAFWQDEDLGIYLGGAHKMLYWRLSFTNGRQLDDRKAQEDDVFPITTDDDDNIDQNGNKQVGIGVGIDLSFKKDHKLDFLPFYYTSTLSGADIDYLQGISTYGASNKKRQERYGFNFEYLLKEFSFFAQYMHSSDGSMDRNGWYIQPSYKIKCDKRKTFTAFEFLLRYENYNVGLAKDLGDSRTWDRQTTTLAIITDVVKNTKIKAEYYFNDESTGESGVDNNELLVQLEVKF